MSRDRPIGSFRMIKTEGICRSHVPFIVGSTREVRSNQGATSPDPAVTRRRYTDLVQAKRPISQIIPWTSRQPR